MPNRRPVPVNPGKVPVIDLTNSFTLVNHGLLANDVIELDDSLNATDPSAENCSSPVATHSRNAAQSQTQRRKNSRIPKLKIVPSKRINAETEQIRERSPLRKGFGDCPICYEKLGVNPLVSTKCGHVFCEKCLENALRRSKMCPACRRVLRGSSAFHPLYLH